MAAEEGGQNRLARRGLRLLQLLETRRGFQVTAAGAWTKHKRSMGCLSRVTKEVVHLETNRLGLQEMDPKGPWMEILG